MIKYKIKNIMEKQGLSARKLAERANIGVNTAALLVKAESVDDYNATLSVIDRVCLALDVDLNEILKYQKR